MDKISKNHHFVPRLFLRKFSKKNDKNKYIINVFNKNNLKKFSTPIENIGYIKNFHTFIVDGKPNDLIEKAHALLFERSCSHILNSIINKLNNFINIFSSYNCISDKYFKKYFFIEHFNDEDKKCISFLLAYFILRGKKLNSFENSIPEQVRPIIKDMYRAHNIFDEKRIENNLVENFGTEEERRLSQQSSIFKGKGLNELTGYFYKHIWNVGVNLNSKLIYSSDNVHALDTLDKRDKGILNGIGYCTYGNVVIFPISPRICICMYDPIFLEDNKLICPDLMIKLLKTDEVKYINCHMVLNGVDEIYSYDGDWEDLEETYAKVHIVKGHKPYSFN